SYSGRGGELFIVDNSVSGWTGVRYLHDWTEIAKSFDVATGYFEIGSLLELDGRWQQLEKIRILMGAEVVVRDGAFVHVGMGSLMDTPTIRPTANIFAGSKASRFEVADDLPQFDEYAS
ncbi:MAG: hypothetical protein ACRDPA_08140, partial [Solirubrobacteraceae bacterium]